MLNLFKLTFTLLFAGFVAAQVPQSIYQPNSTEWWVLGSDNVLAWWCNSKIPNPFSRPSFTVSIGNKNSLNAPTAIIAQQSDDRCSQVIDKSLIPQPGGTGYFITFSNPVNNSEVWVTSEVFEIKPEGSLFRSQIQSSASSSATGAAASSTGKTSGSISVKAGLGAVGLAFAIVAVFI